MESLIILLLGLAVTVSLLVHILAMAKMCSDGAHGGVFAVTAVSALLTAGEFIYIWQM